MNTMFTFSRLHMGQVTAKRIQYVAFDELTKKKINPLDITKKNQT